MKYLGFLKPLDQNKNRQFRFAVMDVESENWTEPFAVGFLNPMEEVNSKYRYWTGENCIEKFLGFFLRKKYIKYKVFIHNGGRYDFSFIIDELSGDRRFRLKLMKAGSRILRLQVQSVANPSYNWWFMDSFALMPASLRKLGNHFGVKHQKLHIDYKNIRKGNWRTYLYYDCMALNEVIINFRSYFDFRNVGLKTTIAQQGLATFRTTMKFPLPTYLKHEPFIKQGYYGGRVEVYKRYGEDLFYYDFNSLYPSQMLGNMPIGKPIKVQGQYPEGAMGFAEAIVQVPYNYIPVLPCRWKGKLIFPYGKLKGVWDIAELEKAKQIGCKVKVLRSLIFDQAPIFQDYVKELYGIKLRAKNNPSLYWISKILLNSVYGKFGQTRSYDDVIINPDFQKEPNGRLKEVCHDLNIWSREKFNTSPHILPALSAHIAALARLKLYNGIEKCHGDVWYVDTDSIITSEKLRTSDKLGELKREHKIVKGYFIAPKFYYLQPNPAKPIVKIKGFPRDAFNEEAFKKALNNDFSMFHYKQEVFGLFSENVRRFKRIVGMITRKKTVQAIYDKRRICGLDTKPLRFTAEVSD